MGATVYDDSLVELPDKREDAALAGDESDSTTSKIDD